MKKRGFIGMGIFILGIGIFVSLGSESSETLIYENGDEKKRIKIAACPTCIDSVGTIEDERYEIVPTASTAESLQLLRYEEVDMILAGRTLKPGEAKMEAIVLEQGYSFLSKEGGFLYRDELHDQTFYTDLKKEEIEKKIALETIQEVEDVYEYIDQGIIITSWENTDYGRAKIVHIKERMGNGWQYLDNQRYIVSVCVKKTLRTSCQ